MKTLFIILVLQLAFVSTVSANASPRDNINSTLSSLKKNVNNVSQGVSRLKQDKLSIEKSLKDMEEWGKSEEEAKDFYYKQNVQMSKDMLEALKTIAEDKVEIGKINDRYHHTKNIFGYVAGAAAVLLYLKLGTSFFTLLAGPYAVLVTFLGPGAAFTAGYMAVKLLF